MSRCPRVWNQPMLPGTWRSRKALTIGEIVSRSSIHRPMRRIAQTFPHEHLADEDLAALDPRLVADHRPRRRAGDHLADALNEPPWQGQTKVSAPVDQASGQPRWVQCGSNTLTSASLWRTTWTPIGAVSATQPSTACRSTSRYWGTPTSKSDEPPDRRPVVGAQGRCDRGATGNGPVFGLPAGGRGEAGDRACARTAAIPPPRTAQAPKHEASARLSLGPLVGT